MSRISFENFGARAAWRASHAVMAGRFPFQAPGERRIVSDVARKLELSRRDDLLEIGCGPGNLLRPLCRRVRAAAGIDHPDALAALERRGAPKNLRLLPGNFLDLRAPGSFSKILVYSVVHYLADERELDRFLDKAAGLLRPGGALLVGDLPNVDKKKRFLSTRRGRGFSRAWERKTKTLANGRAPLAEDRRLVSLDDALLARLVARFRARGHEATLLPQPAGLPFCYTREDLLVRRRER